MVNKQPSLIAVVVFITMLAAQWFFSGGALAAGEKGNTAAENLPEVVTNEPKTDHKKDVFNNLIGMAFVSIPRGNFIMGSPANEPGRTIFEAQNEVLVNKSFYIQTTEVTQFQWNEVMGENPSYFFRCGDDCPVENVSWLDVQEFLEKLNQIDSSSNYRLPTEAEWEFACRSGSSKPFSNGDLSNYECNDGNELNDFAWHACNAQGKTHPVGQKAPNKWGIYDMHGNVYEWCQDIYVTDYEQILRGKFNEVDPIADRVGRSCSYDDTAVRCRSAARANFKPNIRSRAIGFRLVREPVYFKIMMPPSGKKLIISETNTAVPETIQPGGISQSIILENKTGFTLQVAATKNKKNANYLVTHLKEKGFAAEKIKVAIVGKACGIETTLESSSELKRPNKCK